MSLRPARPDEADRLTAIAFAAKRHWGYPETWIQQWHTQLTVTPHDIRQNSTFVAEQEGKIVAFASMSHQTTVATLDHLWVLPDAMRRGWGRALFLAAETVARAGGARLLRLTADPHAEGFYQRMGLVTYGHETTAMEGAERFLPRMEKSLEA